MTIFLHHPLLCVAGPVQGQWSKRHYRRRVSAVCPADRPLLLPQNAWLSANAPLSWGIYRNIPFALLGLLIIVLFYRSARQAKDRAFRNMWLTIVLSFGFYIPVVLWADVVPMIGMLMIPKTCAYVWTVLIGFKAMKASTEI